MAELASPPALQSLPRTARRDARRAEATTLTAPLRAEAPTARPSVNGQRQTLPYENTADRYAFYLFMGTIALGILSMVAMAFAI